MRVALSLLLLLLARPTASWAQPLVAAVEVEGPMGPATADHFATLLEEAEAMGASFVLVRIDTPGGLDASMRQMVQATLASPLPVVCFVAPSGARAASAKTFLLYACHVAAMAPGTTLGAATPVRLGGPGVDGDGEGNEEMSPVKRKALEDAVAYIRGLAELRDRNAEFAEEAVREGASLSAREAVERDVIDLVARDRDSLLNYAGVRLLILGVALMVAEAFVPSFGVRGVGGLIALLVGALLLVDTEVPAFRVSGPVIAALGALSALFFLVVLRLVARSRRARVVSGREALVGSRAKTLEDWQGTAGSVRVQGERWLAISEALLRPGDDVEVYEVDGLTLRVRPSAPAKEEPR